MPETEPPGDPRTEAFPELAELRQHLPESTMPQAVGIGAIALGMALRYHDINTVQDGTLYQQYKLEGRNMRDLQLDMVFETATRIERHLVGTSHRLSEMVVNLVGEEIARTVGEETLERHGTDSGESEEVP